MRAGLRLRLGALALALWPALVAARASPEDAAQLGQSLTPVGAQRDANADGSIPAWGGGISAPPPCYGGSGARYCNPFPDDQPLLEITAANLPSFRDRLSPGQRALFAKYGASYRMRVYATRRSFANPPAYYEGSIRNAVQVELTDSGLALANLGFGTPFPLPASGAEALWNHKLRYRGDTLRRFNAQFAVAVTGEYTLTRSREDLKFPFAALAGTPADTRYLKLQLVAQPSRIAGTVALIHEKLDKPAEALKAWQFAPGDKKLRRAPTVGYDNPAPGTDGLRTWDQDDVFSGPIDRYDYKLIGKRELFVPANSYALHSGALRYQDLLRKGHLNQEHARYELRRVWLVEATLRKSVTHLYRRRTFWLDEDGWQVRLVDNYDDRGELWRVQEGHTVTAYDRGFELPVCETVYDLLSGRYLAQALNNEEPETVGMQFEDGHFDVGRAAKLGRDNAK